MLLLARGKWRKGLTGAKIDLPNEGGFFNPFPHSILQRRLLQTAMEIDWQPLLCGYYCFMCMHVLMHNSDSISPVYCSCTLVCWLPCITQLFLSYSRCCPSGSSLTVNVEFLAIQEGLQEVMQLIPVITCCIGIQIYMEWLQLFLLYVRRHPQKGSLWPSCLCFTYNFAIIFFSPQILKQPRGFILSNYVRLSLHARFLPEFLSSLY